MLKRTRLIETPTKFRSENKYYEYHENFMHTTSKFREVKKALNELADRGQLNCFLKQGKGADQSHRDLKAKENDNSDRNTKILVTIIGGIDDKELNA